MYLCKHTSKVQEHLYLLLKALIIYQIQHIQNNGDLKT